MEEELNRKTAMQLRHQQLHGPLTELVACFLQQSKYPTLARSLDEFIEFSETQHSNRAAAIPITTATCRAMTKWAWLPS